MAYLALDLGAGSGRAILGIIEGDKIFLEEIHRFKNNQIKLGNSLYWDFLSLFHNIKHGISLAAKMNPELKGIAVDTWGVDFGFLDSRGNLLSNPVTYRDIRTNGIPEKVMEKLTKDSLYDITGIQQIEINTLFQLYSLIHSDDPSLRFAERLLFIPDLINYFLTGNIFNEYTIASTSQMLNARTKQWSSSIFEELNLPFKLMSEIIHPGTPVGKLRKDIEIETGISETTVFAIGSHDTASAIGAIPEEGDEWAFLSSGTWSLLGIQTKDPVLSQDAMQSEFTNEGGVDNNILFMRNCTGLWLLQCLLEEWKRQEGKDYDYSFLLSKAIEAKPFRSVLNTDDPVFSHPKSMAEAIKGYCKQTEQYIPETKGEFVRCILESLALKYAFVMAELKKYSSKNIKKLYIVGGGSKNEILNQFVADALNMEVVTGLTEATALGNIIQQAIASGQIENWETGHKIIRNSFSFKSYLPVDHEKWAVIANKMSHLFI